MTLAKVKDVESRRERIGLPSYIFLALWSIFILAPFYWLVLMSIKEPQDWYAHPPKFFVTQPFWDNYLVIFNPYQLSIRGALWYEDVAMAAIKPVADSLVIGAAASAIALTVGLMAAIAVSRYRFGRELFPFGVLTVSIFPPIILVVPLIILFENTGLLDSYLSLILVYGGLTTPFAMWITRGFINSVPKELEEAAMVDGMSRFAAPFRITLPVIKGAIAATFLFLLLLNMGEFMISLSLTYSNVITVPVQLSKYVLVEAGTLYGAQAALSLVILIPILITTIVIRRYLVAGVSFGAVRGRTA